MKRFVALLVFFAFLGLQVSLPLAWADSQIERARRHILIQTVARPRSTMTLLNTGLCPRARAS